MTHNDEPQPAYTVFAENRLIASGPLPFVLASTKQYMASNTSQILFFNDETGKTEDFDMTGSVEEVVARHTRISGRTGPGRPKLGVVGREISLLPRHWDWLEEQPNGASAAIRRLIDEARKREPGTQRERRMRDATARFMWAMAGDLPNFEEATRALYADDAKRMAELMSAWPLDVSNHILSRVHAAASVRAAS
jgi:uncharacterized protein